MLLGPGANNMGGGGRARPKGPPGRFWQVAGAAALVAVLVLAGEMRAALSGKARAEAYAAQLARQARGLQEEVRALAKERNAYQQQLVAAQERAQVESQLLHDEHQQAIASTVSNMRKDALGELKVHQKATMDAAMELEASGKREVELRLQVERLQGELRATQEGAAAAEAQGLRLHKGLLANAHRMLGAATKWRLKRLAKAQDLAPKGDAAAALPGGSKCAAHFPEEGSLASNRVAKRVQWVFRDHGEKGPIDYSHMAMISLLPPRAPWRWIAMWQSTGGVEGTGEQTFMCAFSNDGEEWSKAFTFHHLTEGKGIVWSPSFLPMGDELWLFYAESEKCLRPETASRPPRWSPGGNIKVVKTVDGLTWTAPRKLLDQGKFGNVPTVIANPAVRLRSGTLVLPFWLEVPRVEVGVKGCEHKEGAENAAAVLRSTDGGASWAATDLVVDKLSPLGAQTWLIEGTVAELSNGTALQLYRTTKGVMYSSLSNDDGQTWTQPRPYTLPNPNSKLHVLRLSNGHLVVAYNHEGETRRRIHLQVAISRDDGDTWHKLAELEDGADDPLGQWHYPTVHEDPLGPCKIFVVWSCMFRRAQPLFPFEQADEARPKERGGIKAATLEIDRFTFTQETLIPPEEFVEEYGGSEDEPLPMSAAGGRRG